jgi:hypothetical protein
MKRIGKLFKNIYDIDNLLLADEKARKGKRNTIGVIEHDKEQDLNILKIYETGQVRGLLCNNCNLAIGFFKDDVETLKNVIKYLEQAKKHLLEC